MIRVGRLENFVHQHYTFIAAFIFIAVVLAVLFLR